MKIFLDTNVLASAFGSSGLCAELFQHVLQNHELITSTAVLDELQRILPEKFGATPKQTSDVIALLREYLPLAEPNLTLLHVEVRDPNDVHVLAAAIAARADLLVTGDKDLLSVQRSPVKIVTPRQFFEMLE
jgi:putative PIN family toxin of toxin-antitoxin system